MLVLLLCSVNTINRQLFAPVNSYSYVIGVVNTKRPYALYAHRDDLSTFLASSPTVRGKGSKVRAVVGFPTGTARFPLIIMLTAMVQFKFSSVRLKTPIKQINPMYIEIVYSFLF